MIDRTGSRDDSVSKLLVATHNAGKLRELAELLSDAPFELVSLSDAAIDEQAPETGSTFEENATMKAATYAGLSGMLTLADDSGLEVRALGGDPGPRSSRYAGEGASDTQRIALLLQKLDNIPEEDWEARFRCVIALARPGRVPDLYQGECRGRIVRTPRGGNGFGYDPVFLLPDLGKTMAELGAEQKNRVSHRGAAARKTVAALQRMAAGK